MDLALGVGIGILVAIAGVFVFSRISNSAKASLQRVLLGSVAAPLASTQEMIAAQSLDSKELANLIIEPPAASVDEQPAEPTPDFIKEVQGASTMQEAQDWAGRFIVNKDVAEAIVVLIRWNPRRHLSEDKYQSSFRSFALKNWYANRLEEKPAVTWGTEGDDPNRVAYPDLLLGKEIGSRKRVLVELKPDLFSSSDVDRAMGQMLRYLLAWKKSGPSVLAICGDTPKEVRFLIRSYIFSWREVLRLPVTVYFKRAIDNPSIAELARMPVDDEND